MRNDRNKFILKEMSWKVSVECRVVITNGIAVGVSWNSEHQCFKTGGRLS